MKPFEQLARIATALAAVAATIAMTGCSGMTSASPGPAAAAGVSLHGRVYGGQQPIAGSSIYLYVAGNTGYGATNTNILNQTVTTDVNGNFNITGDYTCTTGQQMYIVAMGGNPGGGTNPQSGIMAALGDCSTLTPSSFISMNEVTTVGSVFALAPFMTGYNTVGSSATNAAGLTRAFASVRKLVDVSLGNSAGPGLPAGATAPSTEINTLANVVAACVNSMGGTAGDNSTCGKLFSLATPTGGTSPADTIGLTLAIAQHPSLQAGAIFLYAASNPPFAPFLTTAPADWTMSINYTGFTTPRSTTIDSGNNVWVADSTNNTVTVLGQTGVPTSGSPISGNGLNGPAAVAMDASGNGWVANQGASSLSVFTSSGGVLSGSPVSPAGLSAPDALAFDATGDIWVTNSGNNSVSELSSAGVDLQQVTTGVTAPGAIAINPK